MPVPLTKALSVARATPGRVPGAGAALAAAEPAVRSGAGPGAPGGAAGAAPPGAPREPRPPSGSAPAPAAPLAAPRLK